VVILDLFTFRTLSKFHQPINSTSNGGTTWRRAFMVDGEEAVATPVVVSPIQQMPSLFKNNSPAQLECLEMGNS
jgi:hypothetical protein